MEFLWQPLLYVLLLVPLLIAGYIWMQARRRKYALRFSSLALVKEAAQRGPSWRRHIPPALFFIALAMMLAALARPFSVVTLPSTEGIVILAIDVSGSMRAEDVKPNRIEAAKTAAIAFVDRQDPTVKIGVVAFSGNAAVVQSPTADREPVVKSIQRLTLGPRTAVGTAILVSINTIGEMLEGDPSPTRQSPSSSNNSSKPPATATPVPPGTHVPAIIVLLTDGQSNTGPAPLEMAQLAADRGVRVYTVGVGTPEGTTTSFSGGFGFRTSLDEKTLKEIARVTDARYYFAKNETDLKSIYENLNTQIILRTRRTEITAFFSAAAVILALVGAAISMLWFNRMP